ncbi:phage holin family protein [Pseudomonas sp. MM211]|uniref:phage holin family protein n=1 Tax=Pseudomonas sp. MM211 TaxID=2866808 RepID=UPI001CED1C9E|nr:phage holin family protein [Pseudomonas sp. MM211]UCJ18282.1 phage holin family protein [Pseudomonas sp. MM211]
MISLVLTHATFCLCGAVFVRLFTYRRHGARFRRGMSCMAMLLMGSSGSAMLQIMLGDLKLPAQAWSLVLLLAVFAVAVFRSGGNLAGVIRECPPHCSDVHAERVEDRT